MGGRSCARGRAAEADSLRLGHFAWAMSSGKQDFVSINSAQYGSTARLSVPEDRVSRKEQLKELAGLAVPIIITFLLEFFPSVTSTLLVGRLHGKNPLDATSLATMFINITAVALGLGLAMALDVLCPQAVGQKDNRALSLAFQRGCIVLTAAFVPILGLNLFAGEILAALGQPADVSAMAGEYTRLAIIGIPFLYLYELLKKVLQARQILEPMLIFAVITNVLHGVLAYVLVMHTSLGFRGAAVSRSVTNSLLPVMLLAFMARRENARNWWTGWSSEAFQGLPKFVGLSLATMCMLAFEMWAFEAVTIMAGNLPHARTTIGAHAILINITTITFNFYLGTQVAANILIGTLLSKAQPYHARSMAQVSVVFGMAIASVFAAGIFLLRFEIPKWYTLDVDVRRAAEPALPILALYQVCDAFNQISSAIFKGTDKTAMGAGANFLAYYIVGLPAAGILAFTLHRGLLGIWWGLCAGLGVAGLLIIVLLTTAVDWMRSAEEARVRGRADSWTVNNNELDRALLADGA